MDWWAGMSSCQMPGAGTSGSGAAAGNQMGAHNHLSVDLNQLEAGMFDPWIQCDDLDLGAILHQAGGQGGVSSDSSASSPPSSDSSSSSPLASHCYQLAHQQQQQATQMQQQLAYSAMDNQQQQQVHGQHQLAHHLPAQQQILVDINQPLEFVAEQKPFNTVCEPEGNQNLLIVYNQQQQSHAAAGASAEPRAVLAPANASLGASNSNSPNRLTATNPTSLLLSSSNTNTPNHQQQAPPSVDSTINSNSSSSSSSLISVVNSGSPPRSSPADANLLSGAAKASARQRCAAVSSSSFAAKTSGPQKVRRCRHITDFVLAEEERRLLIKEGYTDFPMNFQSRPLSKNEEKILRKIRRKIRNKKSAQCSRQRKKEYVEDLERKYAAVIRENEELKQLLDKIHQQHQHQQQQQQIDNQHQVQFYTSTNQF